MALMRWQAGAPGEEMMCDSLGCSRRHHASAQVTQDHDVAMAVNVKNGLVTYLAHRHLCDQAQPYDSFFFKDD